jgi:hypothetical protein
VVAILSADVVMLSRRPLRKAQTARPEPIGLHVDADGSSLRVQWNRHAVSVRNAEHATLFIVDGAHRRALNLTGSQLDRSTVRYLPESELVNFRMEVYNGDRNDSDSAAVEVAKGHLRRRVPVSERVIVEQARPSPFERVTPEIELTQARPTPVIAASMPAPAAAVEPQEGSRFQRVLNRIPLLRRLGKHSESNEIERR